MLVSSQQSQLKAILDAFVFAGIYFLKCFGNSFLSAFFVLFVGAF